jgi:trehalose/maltose transport system substrate-binding protein
MKKRSFITLMALLLLLAACGGDTEGTTTTADGGTGTTDGAGTTEPGGDGDGDVTLRILAGNVGAELESTERIAQAYMDENPGVTVEVVSTPDFVEDRLGVYLQLFEAQSSEGDVFQIDVIWPGDLAEHFIDLNTMTDSEGRTGAEIAEEHFPAIVENNTVDGALIGIPWFTDAGLLYYRSDLLDKYGLEPPQTWDDMEAAAQTIQDGERDEGNEDFWGFVWQGNAYEGLTCDALEWIASAGGGSIIESDGTITINNEAAIGIVDQAAGWVGSISPPGVTSYGEEDARNVWQAGNAAFMRNWPYAYSLGNADDSPIQGLFDVSPLPGATAGETAATLGGWQLAVSKYSAHPEEAAKLAFFMASAEQQKIRAVEYSLNPTIESLYDDQEVIDANPFFASLGDVFTNAVARPSTVTAPNYSDVSSMFFNSVHSVLTAGNDAEDAFAELELDLEDATGFPTGSP